jgi:hypothetical protein
MFQTVGGEHITVAFTDIKQADIAKTKWKDDSTATCRILSMDRRRKNSAKKKMAKSKGFAAKLAAEIDDSTMDSLGGPFQRPNDTQVAIFVAPGPKELVLIAKKFNEIGMGTLVILLNARLAMIRNFGSPAATLLFTTEFTTVFHLAAVAPQTVAPNCLLYCAHPGDWVLARKPAVGQPKTILMQSKRPTEEECRHLSVYF